MKRTIPKKAGVIYMRQKYLMSLIICICMAFLLAGCGLTGFKEQGTEGEVKVIPKDVELEVTFYNVGKADATLLRTKNSKVLIDTGSADEAENLLEQLKEEGVEQIDVLLISHFDKDHVGGAAKILENMQVKEIYTSYSCKESKEVSAYENALDEFEYIPQIVRELYAFSLDGVVYTIYPPEKEEYERDTSNNSSLVVKATYKKKSFLFAGDIQEDRIPELFQYDIRSDVLKVPHHGEKDPENKELFAAVSPDYGIITSSDEELEAKKVKKQLEKEGAAVYLTRKGRVKVWTDGKIIEISQEEENES